MGRSGYPAADLVNDDARETRRRRQPARMRKARCHVTLPRFPSARYRTRRKIPHLGSEIRSAALMHEVQDSHRRAARLGKTPANLDVTAQGGRKTLTEQRDHAAEIMSAAHCGDVSCRAAKATVPSGNRIVPVDREAQRVGRARIVESRNRNRAAGEELTANRNGWQSRERRASQHVIDAKHVPVVVEQRFRSSRQIHGSEHHSNATRIDPVEIDYFADHRA
jgi:hypothetical protein